jgi:hypothetical protein
MTAALLQRGHNRNTKALERRPLLQKDGFATLHSTMQRETGAQWAPAATLLRS